MHDSSSFVSKLLGVLLVVEWCLVLATVVVYVLTINLYAILPALSEYHGNVATS